MKTIKMEDMNWVDIKEAIANGYTTVVVAVGSTEQHGPHLPTKTDALIGDVVANKVAKKLGNALQAQTIRVGCSEHHIKMPGTITLKPETLKSVMSDYIEALEKHGFKTIVLLPSHGGNFAPVNEVLEKFKDKESPRVVGVADLLGLLKTLADASADFGISEEESGGHAGESETSIILALGKDLVKTDQITAGFVGKIGENEIKAIFKNGITALSKIGVLGDPTKATVEKGEVYLEKWADYLTGEIKKQINHQRIKD